MTIHPETYWAVVSPPNPRSKRRYVDYSSISFTRKGSIEKHGENFQGDWRDFWASQRRKGWTAERVTISAAGATP